MVPAKVETADLRPVARDRGGIDGDARLAHRKDAPGAQRRDAVEPRLALVRRIARCNRVALFGRVVAGVIDRHRSDVARGASSEDKAPDSVGHAEQRRECHPHRSLRQVRAWHPRARIPAGSCAGSGAANMDGQLYSAGIRRSDPACRYRRRAAVCSSSRARSPVRSRRTDRRDGACSRANGGNPQRRRFSSHGRQPA